MILEVRSNQEEFNSVRFSPGFNVILADRVKESTKKDSRNGLGKTTLLQIIHFCLGAKEDPHKGLRVKELEDWIFYLDFIMREKSVTVSRSTAHSGHVIIDADTDWSNWAIQPDFDEKTNQAQLKVDDWNVVLGWGLYDLSKEETQKYRPKFRSLISYDIRLNQFEQPFENHPRQFTWDTQVHNAYMLDLNWEYAREWQLLRERKKDVDILRRAIKGGNSLLANILGTIGELENERGRLQRLVGTAQSNLEQFNIHPQYEQIERDANILTRQVHDLSNQIIQTKRLIDFHEQSLSKERPAEDNRVTEIYQDASVTLPDIIVKTLEEVQSFHNQVTQNRRNYLHSEVTRLRTELTSVIQSRKQLSVKRSSLMQILEEHGALSEYSMLQQLMLEHQTALNAINTRIEKLKQIEREASQIRIDRGQLHLDALNDLEERSTIQQAQKIFNENSEALYEAPGDLIVEAKDTGYRFHVDIRRSSSEGFKKMKVFCYDLMRAEIWSQYEIRPSFLIHDSTLFADVDERQFASALKLAASKSDDYGFQYIVCLNSDKLPSDELGEDFNLNDYIRLTLTDDKVEGSLLGIRF